MCWCNPSGKENELRSRRDTSSKAQARTDTYKTDNEEHVLKSDLNSLNSVSNDKTSNRITDPIEYLDDATYFVISDNNIDTSLASECFDTDMLIKKAKMQRTLSSANETPQQRSDDPRRGGRVGFDVREAWSMETIGINHDHEQNDIFEAKTPSDAIRTSTNKLRTAGDKKP